VAEEGDAFLVRLRMRGVVLLMGGDLLGDVLFGMRRPYGQALQEANVPFGERAPVPSRNDRSGSS
jgi:hypothetical protein